MASLEASGIEERQVAADNAFGRNFSLSVACKLNAEIQSVIAVMRQNEKWAPNPSPYYDFIESDDPLLRDFKLLRKQLFTSEDWPSLTPAVFLSPFLSVIRSEKTNIPITGAALTSIHKIVSLKIFGSSVGESQLAMHAIVDAVTACRFEVTDQASEEIVLVKILQVLLTCLQSSGGLLLTDREVCSVVNTCFRVLHQSAGKGELLQRVACHTMQEMIRCVFGRLPSLEESEEDGEGGKEEEEGERVEERDEGDGEVREDHSGAEKRERMDRSLGARVDESGESPAGILGGEEGGGGRFSPQVGNGQFSEEEARTSTDGSNLSFSVERDEKALRIGEETLNKVDVNNLTDAGAHNVELDNMREEKGTFIGTNNSVSEGNGLGSEDLKVLETGKGKFTGKPHGIACMVEVFHFLCSLLTLEDHYLAGQYGFGGEEDMPLFALGLMNSALELGGESISKHPKLLGLVQDELFRNLMQMGLSSNVLVLSLVCSIVLNLYHTLRIHLKLQLEAFFSFVIIRLAQGKYGAAFQQQEVVMEALVDFCRQPNFMIEMFANYDCDITCSNTFEELSGLLSKSAFPVNSPLSTLHVLALEGLLAVVHSISDRVESSPPPPPPPSSSSLELFEYVPFWTLQIDTRKDDYSWLEFVRRRRYIKRRLMLGADHFNRDPKKGLLYLQSVKLLPEELTAHSVACFFRYTAGLNKTLLGEYFGEPHDFNVDVLHEYTALFDFEDMALDGALRTFLESFRLPGEAQKISRVLESFAGRYHKQCRQVLASKDAAYILSYSVIMLNTDQHNAGVKRKMTEDEFIRNNRDINDGKNLPREMLLELYHSIARNEIRISSEGGSGVPEMTYSRWIDLMRRSQTAVPYTLCEAISLFDYDLFAVISGPSIAAISVVFDHTEDEEILQKCVDGFLAVAKISSHHKLEDVLNDLVVSLCKFTTLLNPTATGEEPAVAFGEDAKARMAASTVFAIANKHGNVIGSGWRNILDCVLRLHKLGLLPNKVGTTDVDESTEGRVEDEYTKLPARAVLLNPPNNWKRAPNLFGRFTQMLSLDTNDQNEPPTEQQLAARQRTLRTIEACQIDVIFSDSKFLLIDSLFHLVRALIWAGGRPQRGGTSSNFSQEDEDTAVFSLELLIAVTLNNRDRILELWQLVLEHMTGIVQTATVDGPLVTKAVLGLFRICQRLLPYKEEIADELLQSLQLLRKLDLKVADKLCEKITLEVLQLVRVNACHIKSTQGWRTVCSLLNITARHPDAAESGFEGLSFIMSEGLHVTPSNFIPCLDAAREFAESRLGGGERSKSALDLLTGLLTCLQKWSNALEERKRRAVHRGEGGVEGKGEGEGDGKTGGSEMLEEEEVEVRKEEENLADKWLRLAQAIRRVCGEQREDVRNHAILCLQRCLLGADKINMSPVIWGPCFDQVVFVMLDDLLDIAMREKPKDYKGMEGTLYLAMKVLSKVFLHFLGPLSSLPSPGFRALWLACLSRMEMFLKARLKGGGSEQLQENIPELLKNMVLVMQAKGVLIEAHTNGGDSLWELTWHHIHGISPTMQKEMFPPAPPPLPPLPPPSLPTPSSLSTPPSLSAPPSLSTPQSQVSSETEGSQSEKVSGDSPFS